MAPCATAAALEVAAEAEPLEEEVGLVVAEPDVVAPVAVPDAAGVLDAVKVTPYKERKNMIILRMDPSKKEGKMKHTTASHNP